MQVIETPVAPARDLDLSIVVPVFNEEESVSYLCERLFGVLDRQLYSYEVIIVNDGSADSSLERLREEAARRPKLSVIDLRRNYGQTAALMAGFDHASGRIIVTLDADLQNDPDDIPVLIEKIAEGYDVVSGWRRDRQDARFSRNLVSRIANRVISRILGAGAQGLRLHAEGLSPRRDGRGAPLWRDAPFHTDLRPLDGREGSRSSGAPLCTPIGASKYGLERIFKIILDLAVVKFLDRYLVKPIYIFGGLGLIMVMTAFATLALALGLRVFDGVSLIQTPLPLLAAMLFLMGCISILMGLVAEMLMRTYFELQGRHSYRVRDLINFGPPR